jgi:ribosomal protein S4E
LPPKLGLTRINSFSGQRPNEAGLEKQKWTRRAKRGKATLKVSLPLFALLVRFCLKTASISGPLKEQA